MSWVTTLPVADNCWATMTVHSRGNRSVLIMLPGQTLPAAVFVGLAVYSDGSSIADYLVNNGIDLAFLDPVGYGLSVDQQLDHYDRTVMADQMCLAVQRLQPHYDHVFVHGFCTTAHVPLVTASLTAVSGVMLQSPLWFDSYQGMTVQDQVMRDQQDGFYVTNTVPNLLKNRLLPISDTAVKRSLRLPNWDRLLLDQIDQYPAFQGQARWRGNRHMVWDLWDYPSTHGHQGWTLDQISCAITVFRGQYDAECLSQPFADFVKHISPNTISLRVARGCTHFGMWEINYQSWAKTIMTCVHDLLDAVQGVEIEPTVNHFHSDKTH